MDTKNMVKMTIKRKDGNNLILWFESPYMAQLFGKFIEDLIDGVKRKTHEEIIQEG